MSTVPSGITVTGTLQRRAWIDRVLPPVELVRPGLWSIPTIFPDNPLRYVLTYAIAYNGGVALVDTGWPCQSAWDGLQAGLNEAGWSIDDVKAVLITHGHGDHMGLASRIQKRTGAWVAMHEADALEPEQRRDMAEIKQASDTWLAKRGGSPDDFRSVHQPRPEMFDDFALTPDRFLEDGERPLGAGTDIVAVWTPGHTPGHTCFYDSARNVVLTGDHILPRITPNISPSPFVTDDVLGEYLGSLGNLSDFEVDEVLPAHEYRFRGLNERVHDLRKHHEIRLREVLDVLHESPGANSVRVAEGLRWSRTWEQMQGMPRRFAIGEAYAHLVHLERTGYITNKGIDVDEWYTVRDGAPKLV